MKKILKSVVSPFNRACRPINMLILLALMLLLIVSISMPVHAQNEPAVFVDPSRIVDPELGPGNDFIIFIGVSDAVNLHSWQVKLLFDPTLIECKAGYMPPEHVFSNRKITPQDRGDRQR